ncbi:MAG TPA: Uma2 family endonuclease [Polyangiaceae bacterium]
MSRPVKPRATYEDLIAVAENLVAELVDGELVRSPRPALPHARAASRLGPLLHPFDREKHGPGGWILLHEPELHLHENVLVPDLGGWRRERLPEMPYEAALELAPDWVCEVLSPGTMAHDRGAKIPIYAREGVSHVWLVDPLARLLEVLRLERERYVLVGTWRDDAMVRAEPFDALELELGMLWER